MTKNIIKTDKAPAAIGPYSQATVCQGIAYISGQIAIDPNSGELQMENIAVETKQVLENLKAVVEAAGSSMENVLKCSVFVTDMENFAAINTIYAEYFPGENPPARELVQVAALPKYVNIEISAIAAVK